MVLVGVEEGEGKGDEERGGVELNGLSNKREELDEEGKLRGGVKEFHMYLHNFFSIPESFQ